MKQDARIACVLLSPWPLFLLSRQHSGVPTAVLSEHGRRVLHADPLALQAGVQLGMRESAALSRCPELQAEVVSAPTMAASWAELLELLYSRFSDRIDGTAPGLAFLKVSLNTAREMAAALNAPVGLAGSVETAHLAALRARPGEVRAVEMGEGEKVFLMLTPTEHLHVLGLSAAHLDRLRFLGLRGLADLWKWSAAQRAAFLGVDTGKKLNRFLKGERTTTMPRYVPGQVLESSLAVDQALTEPAEATAALTDLIRPLWAELRGRKAAYLRVQVDTIGGTLTATRKLKWPLDESGLLQGAELALAETAGLELGIDRLALHLSGLAQPSRMVGLWAGVAEWQVTQQVLDRYPDALVKVRWLDPFAYVSDAQYEWVDWLTGSARPRRMTLHAPAPVKGIQARERAVQRVLQFFEGAQP